MQYAVCIDNSGYPTALERHKMYLLVPDKQAEREGDLRVIDESGEDYLYSAARFIPVQIPDEVEESLLKQ